MKTFMRYVFFALTVALLIVVCYSPRAGIWERIGSAAMVVLGVWFGFSIVGPALREGRR